LLTNVLLTVGVVLLISAQSHERLKQLRHRWQSLATGGSA
jgi:hypothetical protein